MNNVYTMEFWISLMILIVTLWARIYIHYIGMYIMLSILGVPITEFVPKLYYMKLVYPMTKVANEVGAIFAGNFLNSIVFGLLMLLSALVKIGRSTMPKYISKFIASYGIAVLLDFFLIALVDLANFNSDSEILKLYNFYFVATKSGLIGVFITIFMYFAFLVFNGFLLYVHLVFLHMQGRIIDLFNRLTSDITQFFVPHDMEVSARYLRWILLKAKRENKENMENPKRVSITTYNMSEKGKNPKLMSHICIFKQRKDEEKMILYRHFLRTPNGSIIELAEEDNFQIEDYYPLLDTWPEEYTMKSHEAQMGRIKSRQGRRAIKIFN
jgi:hypothetical protein